jgi:GDPmannose 4,6-dehydratase
VQEFAEAAFAHLGLDYRDYVTIDPALVRPADVELLLGCATKAERELGWRPRTTFRDLVVEMVEADLAACQEDLGQRATLRDG